MGSGFRSWSVRAAAAWVKTPPGGIAVLILTTFFARLLLASATGLGIDESYMVAAGRKLQLSYFDHPPIAWWMAWGAAHLAGSESAIVVRFPFVALFALTTWLMYRVTAALFGPPAGLWAAVLLNMVPVLGVTSATWVLPDGPLLAALLGAAACLVAALRSSGRVAWGWWMAAGGCAGLALCSKYSAALTIAGLIVFLTTDQKSRSWLTRPHPYVAGLATLAIFAPVLIWNAEHGWISFRFQSGRAAGEFHPLGPIWNILGQSIFVLPWLWVALVWCGYTAARRGPRDGSRCLLLCLAAPPILVFTVASLRSNVLFHWAAPGYLMLLPLLGDAVARYRQNSRAVRISLAATAVFVVLGTALFVGEVRFNWVPDRLAGFPLGRDPSLDIVDWTSLRKELADRGLLDRPGLVVAAMRWSDAGKIDYALGGRVPVICLGPDARQYGLVAHRDDYAGADVLIVAPRLAAETAVTQFSPLFERIEAISPATIAHSGTPAMNVSLLIGHQLRKTAGRCCLSSAARRRYPLKSRAMYSV
jgi:hypothetical protein